LQVQPETGRHAEKARQTQCSDWGDTALLVHQFVDALIRHMKRIRQAALGDLHRFQELFHQHCAGMSRGSVCGNADHDSASVVIGDFNLLGTGVRPGEADPVLLVDPNAVLSFPLSRQGFQSVTRRTLSSSTLSTESNTSNFGPVAQIEAGDESRRGA